MKRLIGLLMLGMTACGAVVEVGDDGADAVSADGLSTTKETFVRIRRDYRKCVSPLCGGYWLVDLNSKAQERYVSGLDFSGSSLDNEVQADVAGGGDGEVVLYGKLGAREPRFGTRPFIVVQAYRGLPGVTVQPTDSFYSVGRTRIACTRFPCPNIAVARLNRTTGDAMATDVSVDRALKPMVDGAWLMGRLMSGRAILGGKIVTSGENVVVEASQVFVQLPDRIQSCPRTALPSCAAGYLVAWNRTENRCSVPSSCTLPGACAPFNPTCEEGYTLLQVMNICPRYVCEPSFLDD
jgi:hypothetical protein